MHSYSLQFLAQRLRPDIGTLMPPHAGRAKVASLLTQFSEDEGVFCFGIAPTMFCVGVRLMGLTLKNAFFSTKKGYNINRVKWFALQYGPNIIYL
jgi:hypothetical protein